MKYRKIDKYKYQTTEPVSRVTDIKGLTIRVPSLIHLSADGRLRIGVGYTWNGSNWSIDYKSKTASLYHDCLYQLMREGYLPEKYREYADRLYRDILIEKGLWRFHANLRYNALRLFGGTSAKLTGKTENKIYEEK